MRRLAYLLSAAAFLPAAASAHVTLDVGQAKIGASYEAVLKVGHGCAGKATTAIRVRLPPELAAARPQEKPGWRLTVERGGEGAPVREITWSSGSLPDGRHEHFVFVAAIPADAKPGPVYVPVVQSCGDAAVRWIEVPKPGASGEALDQPAPVLTLVPNRGS